MSREYPSGNWATMTVLCQPDSITPSHFVEVRLQDLPFWEGMRKAGWEYRRHYRSNSWLCPKHLQLEKIAKESPAEQIRSNTQMSEEELDRIKASISRLDGSEEAAMRFGQHFLPIVNGTASALNRVVDQIKRTRPVR